MKLIGEKIAAMYRKIIQLTLVSLVIFSLLSIGFNELLNQTPMNQYSASAQSEFDWWPMFQHDPAHSGFSSSEVPNTNDTLWVFDIQGTASVGFSPAIVDGRVFVGSSRYFWCINSSSGLMLWNYAKPPDPSTSPAISNGKVIISGGKEDLFCLDVTNGNLIWKFTAGGYIRSSPVIKDGRVFVRSENSGLYCINEDTGLLIWYVEGGGAISPAVAGNQVFTQFGNNLVCLDVASGTQLWTASLENLGRTSPTFYEDKVYIGTYNNTLYCLDSNTGNVIWKYETEGWIAATPTISNGRVFIGDRGNTGIVYCLDAQDGTLIWKRVYEGEYGAEYSSPALADGKVVLCLGRNLFVLNESNGDVVWSYDPPIIGSRPNDSNGFSGSSVAIAEGRIYVASEEGSIYCFGHMLYYTITIDPDFIDNLGESFSPSPSSCTFLLSNGTEINASVPTTFVAPMGSFSIIEVVWRNTEVLENEVEMYIDSNGLIKPRVACILPTDLIINIDSATLLIGFKVGITGNAIFNGVGLTDIPILLSYSVTNGETWNEITQALTSSEGEYSAVWIPSATGNYLVKASWSGDQTFPDSEIIINLAILPFEEQNVFSVTSNSTLSTIIYDESDRKFSFTVTGPEETLGYSVANIAKSIVGDVGNIEVYINDDPIDYSVSSKEDSWLVYFTYPHSTHSVSIQLGSAAIFGISFEIILVIIIIVIALASLGLVYFIKKRQKTSTN